MTTTYTEPREYLHAAMNQLGADVTEEVIGSLEEPPDDLELTTPVARWAQGLAHDLEDVADALREAHGLIDTYLVETAPVMTLADLVLDVERGLRTFEECVAFARSIA